MARWLPVVAGALTCVAACDAVLELDDFGPQPPGVVGPTTSAGGGTSAGGAGGAGGVGGAGAAGGQAPSEPQLVWARSMGSSGVNVATTVTVVDLGTELGFAFAGVTASQTFDLASNDALCNDSPMPMPPTITGAADTDDAFVAVVDRDGCAAWGRVLGHDDAAEVSSLANSGGELWMGGSIRGPRSWNGQTVGRVGEPDAFWGRFDATEGDGVVIAASSADARSEGRGLVAAEPGRAVVAYRADGEIGVCTNGTGDCAIGIQRVVGAPIWGETIDSAGVDEPRALAIDPFPHELVVGGAIAAPLVATPPGCTVGAPVGNDGLVTRLTAAGSCIWARALGGTGSQRVTSVAVAEDRLIVGGTFDTEIQCAATTIQAVGAEEAFVAELRPSDGTTVWCVTSAGPGTATVADVTITSTGDVAVVGTFTQALGFGTGTMSVNETPDGYVVLLDSIGTTRWHAALAGNDEDHLVGVAEAAGRLVVVGHHRRNSNLAGFGFPGVPAAVQSVVIAGIDLL